MYRLIIALLVCSFFLISLDRVISLDVVRSVGQTVLSPISYGLYQIGFGVSQGVRFVVSLPRVYYDNQLLQLEIADLNANLVELAVLEQENTALRSQLEVEGSPEYFKVLASVVGLEEDGRSVNLIIDKGSLDGVQAGQVVVIGDLLVGRIGEVSGRNAYLEPIFSVGSNVSAEVLAQGANGNEIAKGLVRGYFNTQVVVDEVLQGVRLNMNDLVVTSGESGVYPPGLLLGRVDSVQSDDQDLFQRAILKPFWQLGEIRTVFVYTSFQNE